MPVTKTLGTTIWGVCAFMLGMSNTVVQAAPNQASSKQASSTASKPMSHQDKLHLTGDASIGDMLRHPAFSGFGGCCCPGTNAPLMRHCR